MNKQPGAHAKISLQLTLLARIQSCPCWGPWDPRKCLQKYQGQAPQNWSQGAVGVAAVGVNAHKAPSSGQDVLFLPRPTLVAVSGDRQGSAAFVPL